MEKTWDLHTPVGDIVAANPDLAPLLEELGIDYCCGGKLSLEEAAKTASLHAPTLLASLRAAGVRVRHPAAEASENPADYDTRRLIAYIVGTHHDYLRRELPQLSELAAKVATAHAGRDEGLRILAQTVKNLGEDLMVHLKKEEEKVFPALLSGHGAEDLVRELELEHEKAGKALDRIKDLSHGYASPDWACGSYRRLMEGLRTLEADLHRHVHLENNVLFRRRPGYEE